MKAEQKLEEFYYLKDKYERLTPFGLAVVGFDLASKIEALRNSEELSFMKDFLTYGNETKV